jgi:hypothetical protein
LNVGIMIFQPILKLIKFAYDPLIRDQSLARSHEGPHHENAHRDGALRIQNRGRHDCSIFGKRIGHIPASATTIG